MPDTRLIDVDTALRADGKVPVWDTASGTHVYSDPAAAVDPAWQDWTPTLTQSVGVTVTVREAKYLVVGDGVLWRCRLTPTTNGTTNNPIIIGGQPADLQDAHAGNVSPSFRIIGYGQYQDSGTAFHGVWVCSVGATDWRLMRIDGTAFYGQTPNIGVNGSGDEIVLQGMIRKAP